MKLVNLLALAENYLMLLMCNYICDFVVGDIKIAAYLEPQRKINFSLVKAFFVKRNLSKNEF